MKKKKKKNLATKEAGRRSQVEINVEDDMSEKKKRGELMVAGQLRGDAGVALESTCAAPWSAAHSIKHYCTVNLSKRAGQKKR